MHPNSRTLRLPSQTPQLGLRAQTLTLSPSRGLQVPDEGVGRLVPAEASLCGLQTGIFSSSPYVLMWSSLGAHLCLISSCPRHWDQGPPY